MHGDSAQGPHMRCSPFPLGRRQVSAPERSRSRSSVPASSCRNWAVPASLLVGSQRLQQFGLLDAMEAGRLALTAARPGSQRECTAKTSATSDYIDPKDGRRGCDDGVPVLENILGELHLSEPWGGPHPWCRLVRRASVSLSSFLQLMGSLGGDARASAFL